MRRNARIKAKKRRLGLDRLEDRSLLAVNLVVSHDPLPDALPGESISATISVSNFGDETATDAKIETNLDEIIDDLTWTRTTTFETPLRAEQLRAVARPTSVRPQSQDVFEPARIGDLNNDGFDDYARVIRAPHSFLPNNRVEVAFGKSSGLAGDAFSNLDGSTGFFIEMALLNAVSFTSADVNDDGVSDLVIGNGGWGHCSPAFSGICSSGSSLNARREGGAIIVFGSSSIGANGSAILSPSHYVYLRMKINETDEAIRTTVGDVDGDGIPDVMTSGGGRAFVTYGDAAIHAHDFGESLDAPSEGFPQSMGLEIHDSLRFPPEDLTEFQGFGPAELALFDDDADGVASIWLGDDLVYDLRGALPVSEVGAGTIDDLLPIDPGHRVTWAISGTVRQASTGAQVFARTSDSQTDEQPTNNLSIGLEAVASTIELITSPTASVRPGETATWRFRVTNAGRLPLTSATLSESISTNLEDIRWTRVDAGFPDAAIRRNATRGINELDLLLDGFGVTFADRFQLMSEPGRHNTHMTVPGDVNGDGFDDVIAGDGKLFFGAADFGILPRAEPPTTRVNEGFHPNSHFIQLDNYVSGSTRLGDINGDGLDDFAHFSSNRTGQVVDTIRLGSTTADFPTIHVNVGPQDYFAPAGDFDGDGMDDLLVFDISRTGEHDRTFLVPGRSVFSPDETVRRQGDTSIRFDGLVHAIGDLNGDGRSDLMMGSNIVLSADFEQTGENLDANSLPAESVIPVRSNGEAYNIRDMAHGGDLNGDGMKDLMLFGPTPGPRDPHGLSWAVTTIFGNRQLAPIFEIENLPAETDYREVVYSELGTPGDLNGDGIDEPLVWESLPNSENVGVAISGTDHQPHTLSQQLQIYTVEFEQMDSGFDINGDGYEDLAFVAEAGSWPVGATTFDNIIFGRAHGVTHDVDISQPLHLPPIAAVEFEVTGTLIRELDDIAGTISLQLQDHQFILGEEISQSISIDVPAAVPPVAGDVDGDGVVGDADLRALIAGFGKQNALREDGDLDEDGVVTFSDYLILSANYYQPRR